ncbi:hypothetical protein L596_002779 [Steinernema carpocapsae]|uniref:Uncharacterized protein n=1 Tax=Steinernema carpocapsae TaxID=34508 RepID=A0A4U8US34_STECR|nr:hypothetical protein L596_002779 [Steinernema carpocapsae]
MPKTVSCRVANTSIIIGSCLPVADQARDLVQSVAARSPSVAMETHREYPPSLPAVTLIRPPSSAAAHHRQYPILHLFTARNGHPTPVERWNRGQLEDEYHKLYKQHFETKKKNSELEKTLKVLNGRLRRTTGESRQNTEAESAENETIAELKRENELLNQKLKSLKHQLLAYTRPGVRTPMINSLTSRASARPSVRTIPSSVQPIPGQGPKKQALKSPVRLDKSHSPARQEKGGNKKSGCAPASPASTSEKTLVIKLNRELKARMTEVTNLTYKLRSFEECRVWWPNAKC